MKMKPPSGPKKQTQFKPKTNPILSAVGGLQRPKSLAKKSGHTLYNLLCRYSLDGKHCDGIIAEVY